MASLIAEPKLGTPAIEMLDALPPEMAEKYRDQRLLFRGEEDLPQKYAGLGANGWSIFVDQSRRSSGCLRRRRSASPATRWREFPRRREKR